MSGETNKQDICLYCEDISKIYPGTRALDHVSYSLMRGKVNALIGENGAGKSTLMKIIAGIEKPSEGSLYMDGEKLVLNGTSDAKRKGIAIIHQELSLYPMMNVFQNIFMGAERIKNGVLDDETHQQMASDVLKRLGHPIDPKTIVGELSVGQQQIVEIARNLTDPNLRVLIMDEPTSSLSAQEVSVLFKIIDDLRKQGISIVYISHRLEEIMEIGDNITILRDGKIVDHALVKDISVQWIVEKMVGNAKGYESKVRDINWDDRKTVFEARDITLRKKGGGYLLDHVDIKAKEGEILGIYGLLGAGRTEFLECVMGLHSSCTGEIILDEEPLRQEAISKRVEEGFAFVPEDRQKGGLIQTMNISRNIVVSSLKKITSRFGIKKELEDKSAQSMIDDLHIKVADKSLPVLSLSGGNQQKVVIGKGILTNPRVLLLDEPSRGIDVGAKAEVFDIIRQYAEKGLTIIMTSSELKEVLSVSDRIVVLSGGKVTGDFLRSEVSENDLVKASYAGLTEQTVNMEAAA